MATIATWNGHTFEVSPKLIRGFNGLTLKGGCETTDKNTNGQKYLERKYGEIPELSLTTQLNMLTGVTDVFTEATTWVNDAIFGAADYFYMGSRKIFPAKMILVSAEITELVTLPGAGDIWVSCSVKLDFKQGSPRDGDEVAEPDTDDGGGSNMSTGKKKTVKSTKKVSGAVNEVATLIKQAKVAPAAVAIATMGWSTAAKNAIFGAANSASLKKATTTTSNSGQKTSTTTGKKDTLKKK